MNGSHLTYAAVGATERDAAEWPTGFRRLRVRTRLGSGDADFTAAARALLTWRLHRAAGVAIDADGERAAPGVRVTVGLGLGALRVYAPCRVVWSVAEERRAGWAYGTLPGHPVRGEEAFLVSRHDDGAVQLDVLAFSRPAAWWTIAAGPLLPVFQRSYARRCGRVLRRLVHQETGGKGTSNDTAEYGKKRR